MLKKEFVDPKMADGRRDGSGTIIPPHRFSSSKSRSSMVATKSTRVSKTPT